MKEEPGPIEGKKLETGPSDSSPLQKTSAQLGDLLKYAVMTLPARIIAWGLGGLISGIFAFFGIYLTNLLTIPAADYQLWVWLLLPAYFVAGTILMGMAGFARGLGRIVIYAVIEQGLAKFVMKRILDKMIEYARSHETVNDAMDTGEEALENIPLGQAELYLKRSVSNFLEGDELESASGEHKGFQSKVLGWVKKYLCAIIEKYLLAIVRAETEAGGVSMSKVLDMGYEFAEDKIEHFIVGLMNKKTLLMAAMTIVSYALAPISIAIWTAQTAQ
jgi:hypothetical protein